VGRRTPLKSALSTNQLSNIPCASPGAEVVMKCCVEDVLGLFARHSCSYIDTVRRGLVLTKFALKRALCEKWRELLKDEHAAEELNIFFGSSRGRG
jgi:hypothetical protein